MSLANPPSTPLARSKTQALTRVLDLVPRGYHLWTSGQVAVEKAPQLLRKFHGKFGIGCSPAQRSTRKAQDKANASLVMYWPPEATQVEWLLLATDGCGMESERLVSVAAKSRLNWLGYELVRHTARQRAAWTWRRPAAQMADWYRLLTTQRNQHQSAKVAQTLALLANQPGFHGIRAQSWELFQFVRKHGYADPLPHLYFQQKGSHGEKWMLN